MITILQRILSLLGMFKYGVHLTYVITSFYYKMYIYDKEHLQLQHVHHELHRETYFAFHATVYHDTRYSEPKNETKL